jgi:hypothetical protein
VAAVFSFGIDAFDDAPAVVCGSGADATFVKVGTSSELALQRRGHECQQETISAESAESAESCRKVAWRREGGA